MVQIRSLVVGDLESPSHLGVLRCSGRCALQIRQPTSTGLALGKNEWNWRTKQAELFISYIVDSHVGAHMEHNARQLLLVQEAKTALPTPHKRDLGSPSLFHYVLE